MNEAQFTQYNEAMQSVTRDAVLLRQIRQLLAQTRLRVKKVHRVDDKLVRASVAHDAVTHIIAEEGLVLDEPTQEPNEEFLKGGKYGA